MIPGNPHPLLMAGGVDPLDEYGIIARSLRFRSAAGAVLSRSVSSTTDRKKWKVVLWIKGAGLGSSFCLFDAYLDTQNFTRCYLLNTGVIQFDTSTANSIVGQAITASQRRDPAADFELAVTFDSANATAADRMIIEINGVRQALGTYSAPALNLDSWMNTAGTTMFFGRTGSTALYFDGYMAWPRLFDGQIPAATAYGITHPITGQWRPKFKSTVKAAVDAAGANSFFLPFEDTTNTTTLCADASAKGNNFTATNISLTAGATYDSMTDTPTNVFCSLNPILPINLATFGYYAIQPADGNLKVTGSGAPPGNYQNGTQRIKIKAYYEMTVATAGAASFYIGMQNPTTGAIYAYQQDGSKNLNGTVTAYGATFTAGDRVAVSVDPVNLTLEFFKQTGGVGAFVSQGVIAAAFPSADYVPFFYASNGTVLTVNFGQQGFANTSLPSGALALNTKNLTTPTTSATIKPPTAFVAVTASGANVQTTLAAARASFGASYIEIFKRRDAAEGWRWRFSDDLANYLDSSSTAAKAAFPALSGTSYVGYAINVAAANGVATGRLTHVNGVADTVTDGLGNTRKAIILKNESTGAWYFYHPDLTAGKLLYLNQTTAETVDATLGTVLTNSFVVAAALASGTYRWIALAEVDGFFKLGKYTGNANADGPFASTGQAGMLWTVKRADSTSNWQDYDRARRPYNVDFYELAFNSTAEENSASLNIDTNVDIVSNGFKLRSGVLTGEGANVNGATYVYFEFAAFPFRYANAQ